MKDTIVLYPCTLRGHLFSMVELGKLILKHDSSVAITIVISSLPNQTLTTDPYIAKVSISYPSISFVHLPPVSLPPPTSSITPLDFAASIYDVPRLHKTDLHKALSSLSQSTNVTALVIDFFCNEAFEVSSNLKIPTYYFYTSGACGLAAFLYYAIIDRNIKESLKDLDILLDIPGVPKIPSKDMPPVLFDKSHRVYKYFIDTGTQMGNSAGLIVNTFEMLEEKAIKAIQEGKCTLDKPAPPLYCVGPVLTQDESKDEHECLTWLDSQPSHSVVFLCFGSEGVFSARQLKEMATGLEESGVSFLWVVRNPPENVSNRSAPTEPNLELLLPEGFLERTKDRGFIVKSWAPQVAVLNHPSVGGFVTHCGWNSVLEALCAGVPMLAWPLYAEQKMNRVFLVEEMKIALAVNECREDGFVSAAKVEKRVTELMNSDEGKAVKEQVEAMRDGAVAAKSDGGSSRVAIVKLIDSFKQLPRW